MTRGWVSILRDLLALGREVQLKTQRVCPNQACPLNLNKSEASVTPPMTQDEMINRQRELYKKNHPGGGR